MTATRTGFDPVNATAAETGPVAPGELVLAEPARVTGSARPGSTLGLAGVPEDVTVAVQWLRDGAAVAGATAPSYRLTAEDLGSRVVAALRLTRPGYDELAIRTSSTPVVRAAPRLSVRTTPGTRSMTVRALVSARDVSAINGILQVRRGRKLIATVPVADGTASANLTNLPRGKRLFRFKLASSPTFTSAVTTRKVRIR
ncbi:MAG: hypothetical protein ABIN79_06470 [Marmoricola sp.]